MTNHDYNLRCLDIPQSYNHHSDQNDISLKGEFIRTILDSNEAETDKEEIIKLGIEALSGDIKI